MSVRRAVALLVAAVVAWSGASAMAAPVVPVLRGVYDPGNGRPLQALWGYSNLNAASMSIPLGMRNLFSPGPISRGQPTTFVPGTVYGAFVTDFDGSPLTWTLDGTSVTASGVPSLPVDPSVLLRAGELVPFVRGVWEYGPNDYAAVFGYANGKETSLTVPAGSSNLMTPAPFFREQPVTFAPGVVAEAVVVHFTGSSVAWTLGSGGNVTTVTADTNSPRLGFDPLPEPGSVGLVGVAIAGGLVRRRRA